MPNDPRSDLDSRISAIESQLREILGHLRGESPPQPEAEPATADAATSDASGDLFEAVVAIDRGGSQQQVLAAMLEGTGRFASRSAIFLTRADAAQGWGSYGFDEGSREIQQVTLSYGDGPLATLAEGRGCVVLSGDECAAICREMGATPGAEGLLVPFVLRDRVAAALYVDRFAEDPRLSRRTLQLLTYVGAQAVEGLALRDRSETPTLQVAGGEDAEPGVALWEGAAGTEAPAEEPPPAEAPEPAVSGPRLTEPQTTEPQTTEPHVSQPQVSEPGGESRLGAPVASESVAAPMEPISLEPAAPEQPPMPEPPPLPEQPAAVELEPATETPADDDWQLPPVPGEEPTQPLESLAEPSAPATEEPQPWEATGGAAFSTAETGAALEPSAPAPPAPETPAAGGGETTEVRPPTDVSGPGWAFTASRAAAEAGDDAQHEEARRLARLLVTEIKLYNEEQVEEGRRGNDIYPRLREDIDRSRQIFNERVDESVRQETDYFHEEMVRILGGGNAETLGI